MGLFDFLNPKKTIEKKLTRSVEREMGHELTSLRSERDPVKRREKLARAVEIRLQAQANQVIPNSLRKHSKPIMKNVSKNLVAKLDQQLAAQAAAA